ncbi:bacterial regulatory helix-turn-helix, lysR family protein, partial [Vibrio parahaemolyticus V-223/04]
ETDAR